MFDSSGWIHFALCLLVTVLGLFLTVRRVSSRYFAVDAGFGAMSIGGDGGDGGDGGAPPSPASPSVESCTVCGDSGTKKCSGCKRVRYCSQACQSKHWEADHRFKCKQMRLIQNGEILSPVRKISNKILFPYDEFLKLYDWSGPDFRPCGLSNCGNSCFVNVVLQCLACTRPLVAYLLGKDHSKRCVRKEDWCFLCELQLHVKIASQSSGPIQPLRILDRLPKIGGNLGYGRQEDAHEFMRFAIDKMQSACLDEFGGEKFLDLSTQETTLIQHIFGGHLQSQVVCTECEMVSNRYDNMMDLTVEIQGDAESLEECLDQFTAGEWLDGDNKYKCDGCNDYVKAWKRLTVHQAPNILTIALKRFQSGRFGKLNKRITFPVRLDLSPYTSVSSNGEDLYDLYAVVVHLDMLNASFFGHYICYTKDRHGTWYRIDDCKVAAVEVEEVLAQGAYMLLYTRRTPRQEPLSTPKEPSRRNQQQCKLNNLILPAQKIVGPTYMNGGNHQNSELLEDSDLGMPNTDRAVNIINDNSNSTDNGENDDFAPLSPLREDTLSNSSWQMSNSNNNNNNHSNNNNSLKIGKENGSVERPKELFSRGFLDRPRRKFLSNNKQEALCNGSFGNHTPCTDDCSSSSHTSSSSNSNSDNNNGTTDGRISCNGSLENGAVCPKTEGSDRNKTGQETLCTSSSDPNGYLIKDSRNGNGIRNDSGKEEVVSTLEEMEIEDGNENKNECNENNYGINSVNLSTVEQNGLRHRPVHAKWSEQVGFS